MGRYDYEPNRINKEDSLEYRYGNNPKVKKEVSLEWRIAKGMFFGFVLITIFYAIINVIGLVTTFYVIDKAGEVIEESAYKTWGIDQNRYKR